MFGQKVLPSYDEYLQKKVKSPTFERNAMQLLLNAFAMESRKSSPIRKGSYDLLLLLSLQESIHRVLREYRDSNDEKRVSFEWLRNFYDKRLALFDGCGKYERYDDFVEELLRAPPSVVHTDDQSAGLVDPLRIASDIIAMREEVIGDWSDIASSIPEYHIGLRKGLLSKQLSGQDGASPNDTGEKTSSYDSWGALLEDGAFE